MAEIDLPDVGGDRDAWGSKLNAALIAVNDEQETGRLSEDALQGMVATALGASGLASRSGPDVSCFGDSLTAGTGGTPWPTALRALITAGGWLGAVHNFGVGGESSRTISGRQGGRPMLVTVPSGSIPASGGVTVTVAFDDGVASSVLVGGTAGVNPVDIAGVRGTLSLVSTVYTFTRASAGSVVAVPFPVPLITEASRDRGGDIQVMWMGQNDGTSPDPDLLIGRFRSMIEKLSPAKKSWVAIGLSSGTAASRSSMEIAMLSAFGRRYINIRQYLSSSAALALAGITPTTDDTAALAEGSVPPSLRFDDVHLNTAGYQLVAGYVYARLVELEMLLTPGEVPPPELPEAYDIGVSGWDHRYLASDLDDGTVASWLDHIDDSPLPLASPTGGTITHVTDGDMQYVRMSAAEVAANAQLSDSTPRAAQTRTVAVLMRAVANTGAAAMNFLQHSGIILKRQSNGTFALQGTGTNLISIGSPTLGTWKVVLFEITASVLTVDGVTATPSGTWTPTASAATVVGPTSGATGSGTRTVDYAEIVQWPRLLDETERTAVRSAMMAEYGLS